MTLAPFAFDIALKRPDQPDVVARVSADAVSARGSFPDSETVTIQGGRLSLPAYHLSADHVAGDVGWESDVYSAEMTVARISHMAEPAYFAPVGARIDGKLSNDKATFAIGVFNALGDVDLSVTGRHDVTKGSGEANLALEPLHGSR